MNLLESIAGKQHSPLSGDHLIDEVRSVLGARRADSNAWVTTQNLVVCLPSPEDSEGVLPLLDQVAQSHPSRAVVVAFDPESEGDIQGGAATICSQSNPGKVCSERIGLVVPGTPDRVPSLVLPLLIPGVMTYLWWRGDPPFGSNLLERLVEASERVVFDSGRFHLTSGMKRLQRLMDDPYHGEQAFSDLAWGRITTVRERVAQLFDGAFGQEKLEAVEEVDIQYAGDRPTPEALLVAGWLSSRLGWDLERPLHSEGKAYVATYEGTASDVKVRLSPGAPADHLEVGFGEQKVESSLFRGCGLLQREFDLVDRDRVYEEALDAILHLIGEKEG